jgi:hypothetical protein
MIVFVLLQSALLGISLGRLTYCAIYKDWVGVQQWGLCTALCTSTFTFALLLNSVQ